MSRKSRRSHQDDQRASPVGGSAASPALPSMRNMSVSESVESTDNMESDGLRSVDVAALQRQVADLNSNLDLMRANRQQEQRVYKLELQKLECEKSALEKRIQVLLRDMDDKDAMGEYAMLINKATPNTVDSTYVLKLQSQLAKAMHQMGTIQNQLTLTQQACDGIVNELRDEMRKITERNSKTEIDYLNQIMQLQNDNLNMTRMLESAAAAMGTEDITEEEEAEVVEENCERFDGAPPPVQGVVVENKAVDGSGRRRTREGVNDTSRLDRTSSRQSRESTSGAHRKAPQSPRNVERRARHSLGKAKLESMVQDMIRPTSLRSFGDNMIVSLATKADTSGLPVVPDVSGTCTIEKRRSDRRNSADERPTTGRQQPANGEVDKKEGIDDSGASGGGKADGAVE